MTTVTEGPEGGLTPSGAPSIHVLMGRVLADLPPIDKSNYNSGQRFHFRGYDDVMNALNPILAKHGVFFLPNALDRVEGERPTGAGKSMTAIHLHVQYTFYGPNGDCVVASGWGEATDSGDKATSKAMTMALKYVLFQVFAISCKEAALADPDADPGEPVTAQAPKPAQQAPRETPPAETPAVSNGQDVPITTATKNLINKQLKGAPAKPHLEKCFPDEVHWEVASLTEAKALRFVLYLTDNLAKTP